MPRLSSVIARYDRAQLIDSLESIRDYLRWSTSQFNRAEIYCGHGTETPWDEAVYLLSYALRLPAQQLMQLFDAKLTREERTLFVDWINLRIEKRIPAAYITNEAWFAGIDFFVDERVLVPRSPIAELIENQFSPWLSSPPKRILDLCCGSGCIGIAAALFYPEAEVILADLSDDALTVAEINIARHKLADRVSTVKSDVFSGLEGEVFDLILSNPPYVDAADLAAMPPEYHAEPAMGLGAGDDGLDIARRILAQGAAHLEDKGLLVIEVGNSWEALEEAYPQVAFTWAEFERGGHGVCLITREDLGSEDAGLPNATSSTV